MKIKTTDDLIKYTRKALKDIAEASRYYAENVHVQSTNKNDLLTITFSNGMQLYRISGIRLPEVHNGTGYYISKRGILTYKSPEGINYDNAIPNKESIPFEHILLSNSDGFEIPRFYIRTKCSIKFDYLKHLPDKEMKIRYAPGEHRVTFYAEWPEIEASFFAITTSFQLGK